MNTSHGPVQPGGPQTPEQALMLMRIVWGALLFSQFMYLYIGTTVLNPPSAPVLDGALNPELTAAVQPTLMEGLQNPQGTTMALVALVALVMSFTFPKRLPVNRTNAKGLSPQGRLVQTKFLQFVVGCALNEMVAFVGLAAGFIVLKNSEYGSALIYVSIAAMLLRFPTAESMRDASAGPATGQTDSRSL